MANEKTNIRVLMVDINADDFTLVKDYLRDQDWSNKYQVEWADSFEKGRAALDKKSHDIYLVDYFMGSRNGLELVERWRALGSPAPLIMLTGISDRQLDHESLKTGVTDFIQKSDLNAPLLERSIRFAIERHHMINKMANMATRDELTGLYNLRGFNTLAEQALKLASRRKFSLCLFHIDLEHQVERSEASSSITGNEALAAFARVMRQTFRDSDILGRIGGERFAALTIEAGAGETNIMIKRLHLNLSQENKTAEPPHPLAISVGWAEYDPENPKSFDALSVTANALMIEQKSLRGG